MRGISWVDDVVLDLARRCMPGAEAPFFPEGLVSGAAWPACRKKIFEEGVSGLVFFYSCEARAQDRIPPTALEDLREDYLGNFGRNIFLSGALKKISLLFEERRIPAIFFRGADFFQRLYPSVGVRALVDLDLLVRQEELAAAKGALVSLGYAARPDYACFFSCGSVIVDLHVDEASFWKGAKHSFAVSAKDPGVWKRSEPLSSGFSYVRRFGSYDAILSCCHHLMEHSFGRLIWFMDIAALVKHEKAAFDWDRFVDYVFARGSAKPVLYAMRYLDATGLLSVPERALSRLSRVSLNFFEARSLQLLLQNRRKNLAGELLYFFALPKVADRLRFLGSMFFPGKGIVCSFRTSRDPHFFCYFLKRLARIVFDMTRRLSYTFFKRGAV
jgi:hypothetical protein